VMLEAVPSGPLRLEASAEDAAGNMEKTPMVVMVE
jgi:hypothetical protein